MTITIIRAVSTICQVDSFFGLRPLITPSATVHAQHIKPSGSCLCGDQIEIRIVLAPPDKTVEHIVHELRQGKQRHEQDLQHSNFPWRAEEPDPVLPDSAVPKHLFNVSYRPQADQKDRRSVGEDSIHASPAVLLHSRPAVPVDQREVGHPVNDKVGHCEGIVRIEPNDAYIPTYCRCHYDDVFPRIPFPLHQPTVQRLLNIGPEREPIERRSYAFDQRRDSSEVIREEPPESSRQVRVPIDQRVKSRSINRHRINPFAYGVALAGARSVPRNPTVLLTNEMKPRQVSEHPPEDKLAFRVKRNAYRQTEHRHKRIQPRPPTYFIFVEIDSKTRRPYV